MLVQTGSNPESTMTHLEERMETDLNYIRDWLWKLGEDVESALTNAKRVLALRDSTLAYDIILCDHAINRDSRECDRLCHTFIARYLPGAGALREMASTIRINVILERVGDYAVTICREALQLEGPLPERFSSRIDSLADDAIEILTSSRSAFREGNAERAIALMQAAKRMEGRMDGFYEELFAEDDRMDAPTMMAIFTVFNMFKRVADQAKNICDQTVYAVRGVKKIPKVYPILFLDQLDSGLGQLATAIGRHSFPETAKFAVATPGGRDAPSTALREFLEEAGLPENDLETEPLEALVHDLSHFIVLVAVKGTVSDYVDKVPFHTSARNWIIPESADQAEKYRLLRREINDLVTLLAGEHPEQG
jgi:phosphate transport system protein